MPTSASRDVIDAKMAKALSHPLRVEIMAEFGDLEGGLMSANQFALRHDENVSYVSHHFRALEKHGLIEEVEQRSVRGATEHFYRPRPNFIFEGRDWERLPLHVRESVSGRSMNNLLNAVAEAAEASTFENRPGERALGWGRLVLDEKGWKRLAASFRELIDVAVEEGAAAKKRLAESGEEPISAAWGLLLFESPSQDKKGRRK